jgi:hypothetical protein
MSNKHVIIVVVVAVLFGGIGFFGGVKYNQAKAASTKTANTQQRQQGSQGGAFAGRGGQNGNGGVVTGQILSKDDQSMTIQLPNNGGSKIVFYSTSTQISKMAPGASSDLTNGEQVIIMGKANSDGSVTAQTVQIRPNSAPGTQNK